MPAAPPALDLAGFRQRTVMRGKSVDLLESDEPGFLASSLARWQSMLYALLRKRYAIPFADPAPEILLSWLTHLTTLDAYRKRGISPDDPLFASLKADADLALAQAKEAANSSEGLFDLPVSQNNETTAVTQGGPMSYSETSPYAWQDLQATQGIAEDQARTGTTGTADVG